MKTQNPWMGRARKSAGNMTACKMYDANVLRAKAFEVSNPKTEAQMQQRRFFAELSGIVNGLSKEELRSLFGVKPKKRSRRSELAKQVAKAYSIDGNEKVIDFSKLSAIGNGVKVSSPIIPIVNGEGDSSILMDENMFPNLIPGVSNAIVVIFDQTNKVIKIVNTATLLDSGEIVNGGFVSGLIEGDGYAYVTMAADGSNTTTLSFGSFIIKTREEKYQAPSPAPTQEIEIHVTDLNAGATITVNLSNTPAAGCEPMYVMNGEDIVVNGFIEESQDNYYGELASTVNPSLQSTITVMDEDDTSMTLPVKFVEE